MWLIYPMYFKAGVAFIREGVCSKAVGRRKYRGVYLVVIIPSFPFLQYPSENEYTQVHAYICPYVIARDVQGQHCWIET